MYSMLLKERTNENNLSRRKSIEKMLKIFIRYACTRVGCDRLHLMHIFMPPNSKKLTEHIGFGLCVRLSVRQEPCMLGF